MYVEVGERVLLKCSGESESSIQWYKDDVRIGDSEKRIKFIGKL